jgi:serine/threonine protein kinase/tetratricopeptide (TPR) repeat protein
MIGRTVSHYRILGKLGEGGMGVVYLAEDTQLARRVAMKFLTCSDHHYRARFLREARAVSALSHPNIASVFDYGETPEGQPYIVLELVKGKPLSDLLQAGGLALSRAVEIVAAIAEALGEAHHQGIVHRDVKPSNVVITERGQVKVLDFGLVKILQEQPAYGSDPEAATLYNTQTGSDIVVGTPLYLSPEQAMGKHVDARSDLFALGALLYECITGRAAFSGSSVLEIAGQVIHVNPRLPSQINTTVPAKLDRITMKALEKSVDSRYQSAEEMLNDLRAVLATMSTDGYRETRPSPRLTPLVATLPSGGLKSLSDALRRPRLSIGFLVIVVVAIGTTIAAAIHWWRPSPHQPSAAAQAWFDTGTEALREGSYYQATKALEQAINADDKFALAHARLSEAWAELDYTDKAKDEILRVSNLVPNRSIYAQLERLSIDAITATVTRDLDHAVEAYREIARLTPDQPRVYVDLGRAYEKIDNTQKAIDAYVEAANRDPQYATPFLRLGYLYGRQQDLANANSAFDKADKLYDGLGNIEGRGEVYFQRGFLFDNLGKPTEASEQLQRALDISSASGNRPLQIKTLMQLSGVVYDGGDSAKAKDYAREAVDLARANGMENLTARGLVNLGYAFLNSGDYADAEKYFNQSLEFAQRYRSRRNEARALFALGSLRERQGESDQVIRLVEPALAFYQSGGFRKEAMQCLTLVGRARRNQGDYDGARKLFDQQLQLSQQAGDQSQLALAHEGIGNVLNYQENYPEALSHFDEKYAISKALGKQSSIAVSLISRGELLGQLGRYSEARDAIKQAEQIVNGIKGGDKRISAEIYLLKARTALNERNFSETKANCQKAIEMLGKESEEVLARAKYLLGFAEVFSGQSRLGQQTCKEALGIAMRLNHQWLISASMLALAQSMIESGDAKGAFDSAIKASDTFVRSGQKDSQWRALLIASRASHQLGDREKTRSYARQSDEVFSELKNRWRMEDFEGYIARPDVRFLRRQLSEMLVGSQ